MSMLRASLLLVLSVNLGGGFGEASATIHSVAGESMNISIQVEVEDSADSVVAHLFAPGEQTLTLPLLHRGDGLFGIQTELRMIDYQVVFEAIGEVGAESESISLTALGAEFPTGGVVTTTTEADGFSSEARGWGWLALGLTAASLSVLAIWVLGGKDNEDDVESESQSDSPAGDRV